MDNLKDILLGLAEKLDLEQLDSDANGHWRLIYSDTDWFEIASDDDRRVLSICQDLAKPAEKSRLAVYAMALQYNYLWTETGGARLALDGPDGSISLSVDIAYELCESDYIENAIRNFREIARSWKDLLLSEGDNEEVGMTVDPQNWIRG